MPSAAVDRVRDALDAADSKIRKEGNGWSAQCPAHDDRSPSLHFEEAQDGKCLIFCHAGCSLDQIASGLGIDVRELFEPEDPPAERRLIASYDYVDEHGQILYQVCRFEPKTFKQRRPDGRWGISGIRRIPYHLPQLLAGLQAGKRAVVVEGEKDVHALEALGHIATCNPGGAGKGKWKPEWTAWFKDATVAIIADRDDAGRAHAHEIYEALKNTAKAVKIFEPAVGKDIADHIAAGMPLKQLVCCSNGNGNGFRVELMTTKQVMALPDPEESQYLLGPLLYRGQRVILGGHTGHGKTTLVMRMTAAAVFGKRFLEWAGKGGLRALVVDVEQGTKTIKRQIREAGLQDEDRVSYWRVPDGLALDRDESQALALERKLDEERFDIVVADPLYKLGMGNPNNMRDADHLMRRFDNWRTRFGFCLILPMHPRKPQDDTAFSAHDLFGSAAWQWGAEVILGIERVADSEVSLLHWWKDREGELPPINTRWRLLFDRESTEGFHRIPDQPKPKKFMLTDFIMEMLHAHGEVTREAIRSELWKQRKQMPMGRIDKALADLLSFGVIHNEARLLKDRIYYLQPTLPDLKVVS